MDTRTIFYVDEELTDSHQFERKLGEDFNVSTVNFEGLTFESLVEQLSEKDFDYLIVDYHLNEKSNCGFNGDEVIKAFLEKFPRFPTMLLTNHDQHAVDSAEGLDVDTIHNKKEYIEDERREVFIKRINAKISQYREANEEAETKIILLIQKRQSGEDLTANEEDELIKLDAYLDETLAAESPVIPDDIKTPTNAKRITELLEKTDSLIDRLNQYENI
jgi:DNA-binding NarL/FixJ family response regulator